jgi:hypothetical protein
MRNLYMYYKRLKQYIEKREKIESQQQKAGGGAGPSTGSGNGGAGY